jgi:hypothetical protein
MRIVICSYCIGRAERVKGSAIYPQYEKLKDKLFWQCAPCGAHVGCHPGTDKPLGTLAKARLRRLRHECHVVFDKKMDTKTERSKSFPKKVRGLYYPG